jgi:DNA-binding MarR family transcriptional regulator
MSLPPTWDLFGDDHIPHRLQLLAKMIDRETSKQLQREFGMSLAEWRVLAYICAAGPASASEVGAASAIDRAEVSRAVAKLERDVLLARTVDPHHRKRLILEPTTAGRDSFTKIRSQRRRFFQKIMSDIPQQTREQLNHALRTIALGVQQAVP